MRTGVRAYKRSLLAIAKAAGGVLEHGQHHWKIVLPSGHVVPASASPSCLKGGRPVRVERAVERALSAGKGRR